MPQSPEEQADNLPTAEPEKAEALASSEYPKTSVIVTILRWVAVLPATLAAALSRSLVTENQLRVTIQGGITSH